MIDNQDIMGRGYIFYIIIRYKKKCTMSSDWNERMGIKNVVFCVFLCRKNYRLMPI